MALLSTPSRHNIDQTSMTSPESNGGKSQFSNASSSSKKKSNGFFSKLLRRQSKDLSPSSSKGTSHSTPSSKLSSRGLSLKRSSIIEGKGASKSSKSSRRPSVDYSDHEDSSLYIYKDDDDDEDHDGKFGKLYSADHDDVISSDSSLIHSIASSSILNSSKADLTLYDSGDIDANIALTAEFTNDSTGDLPWGGLKYESLVQPRYMKTTRRKKHSPSTFRHLFLAQELNKDDSTETSAPDTETISIESHENKVIGGTTSSDDIEDTFNSTSDDPDGEVADDTPQTNSRRKRKTKSTKNEIYVMEFSRDGKYLATAGRDASIKIWKVISSPLAMLEYKRNEAEGGSEEGRSKRRMKRDGVFPHAPVFHSKPVRVFQGHTHNVLSLDWSKNNFLISGSMDRTVRLWHIDRPDCLQTFPHDDFVTSVKFHPTDDRFFLSGSLDNKLRLWSVLEQTVAYVNDLGDDVLITAVSFTPDGMNCLAGGFNGSLFTLETKGLHVKHRFEVKEKYFVNPFHNKNGNKITGIKVFENPNHHDLSNDEDDPLNKWNILVTTNDSKVRLVNSSLKKLVTRFKGLTNNSSSIVASMSDDLRYIISGSEDHWCYVWENNNTIINNRLKLALKDFLVEGKHQLTDLHNKHKKTNKMIHANGFLKKLNVQRFLDDDEYKYEYISNENHSYSSFHPHHSKVNCAIFAPRETSKLLELSDDILFDMVKRKKKYDTVSKNLNSEKGTPVGMSEDKNMKYGYIVVTTDQYGLIRVFRQDVAFEVRKKLLNYRKKCLRGKQSPEIDCNIVSDGIGGAHGKNPNLRLDLPHLNLVGRKLLMHRSLSPTHEGYTNLKNKLHSKMRGTNGSLNGSNPGTPTSGSTLTSLSNRPPLTDYVSSSAIINGRHTPQSQHTSMFSNHHVAVDLGLSPEKVDDNLTLDPVSLKSPASTKTLVNPRRTSNKSENASVLSAPEQPQPNKPSVPLIINTTTVGSDEGEHSELVHFQTPHNVIDGEEQWNNLIHDVSFARQKSRGRRRQT